MTNTLLTVLIAANAACPRTQVIDAVAAPWGAVDVAALERATYVCSTRYAPRSPCLVKFERLGVQSYHATCGTGRKS